VTSGAGLPLDGPGRRAATRLILRFIQTRLLEAARVFGGDLTACLVFVAVTRANVDHVDAEEALFSRWSGLDTPPPDDERRPASGYMVAHWLGMSRETVRRKLNLLLAMEMIEHVEGGYRTNTRILASPEGVAFSIRAFEAAGSFFRALSQTGLAPASLVQLAGVGPPRPRMAGRAMNSFLPLMLDGLLSLGGGDLTTAVVLAQIIETSMAEPPQRLTSLAVSEVLGLSRETGRRHVAALMAAGKVSRVRGGLAVADDFIDGPVQRALLERSRPYLTALIERLARAGVLAQAAGSAA
jgi:hypothetical protein